MDPRHVYSRKRASGMDDGDARAATVAEMATRGVTISPDFRTDEPTIKELISRPGAVITGATHHETIPGWISPVSPTPVTQPRTVFGAFIRYGYSRYLDPADLIGTPFEGRRTSVSAESRAELDAAAAALFAEWPEITEIGGVAG